jgi:twitching motility protein PilT
MDGAMRSINIPSLSPDQTQTLIYQLLSPEQIKTFEHEEELDTSIDANGIGRFRLNVLRQKNGIGAILRIIPTTLPTVEEIALERQIQHLINLPRGLILVTGATGSGKSTTLACLINLINQTMRKHIITVEDPIEFVYPDGNCVITQREVGAHTHGFSHALKYAMRQDPDIILIGEMRDLETISAALSLAETGHLVLSTLHTADASKTVDRIIDAFPTHQQPQIRSQLASSLKAVICQHLLPRRGGKGRVAAREIMLVNNAIASLIRDGKTHQIYSVIDLGSEVGMKSLERDLARLVDQQIIDFETALQVGGKDNITRG